MTASTTPPSGAPYRTGTPATSHQSGDRAVRRPHRSDELRDATAACPLDRGLDQRPADPVPLPGVADRDRNLDGSAAGRLEVRRGRSPRRRPSAPRPRRRGLRGERGPVHRRTPPRFLRGPAGSRGSGPRGSPATAPRRSAPAPRSHPGQSPGSRMAWPSTSFACSKDTPRCRRATGPKVTAFRSGCRRRGRAVAVRCGHASRLAR